MIFAYKTKTVKSMIHPVESTFGAIFSTKLNRLLKLSKRSFLFAPNEKWMNVNEGKKGKKPQN